MVEQTVQIVANTRDTDAYFRLVLRAPQIAPLVQPGQFAHVRVLPLSTALLRRPFSIFQVTPSLKRTQAVCLWADRDAQGGGRNC